MHHASCINLNPSLNLVNSKLVKVILKYIKQAEVGVSPSCSQINYFFLEAKIYSTEWTSSFNDTTYYFQWTRAHIIIAIIVARQCLVKVVWSKYINIDTIDTNVMVELFLRKFCYKCSGYCSLLYELLWFIRNEWYSSEMLSKFITTVHYFSYI